MVNENNKYYTPAWLCEHTIKKAIEIIGIENITEIVESSAGDGTFITFIKEYFPNIIHRFYDILPEHPEIIQQDYKTVRLSYKRGRLTGFNPPFGTSSSLWKAFCKKAASNSDYIVFISPASQYNSNYYFKEGVLVYSELLNDVVYRGSEKEGGKDQAVRTCLNIYKVYDREENDYRLEKINSIIKYGRVYRDGDGSDKDYDYYLASMTNGSKTLCHLCKQEDFYQTFGIKIIDKRYRNKIEEFLNNFYQYAKELQSIKNNFPAIDNPFFLNKLKTFLYPTREERLKMDVLIEYAQKEKINEYHYFLERKMRCAGELHKNEIKYHKYIYNCFGIIILNKDLEEIIVEILSSIRWKTSDYNSDFPGAYNNVNINVVKDYLIKHLYPTREERLEQDILIDRSNKFDYCVGRRGNGYYGKLLKENNGDNFSITILNESIRENLSYILTNLRTNSINKLKEIEGTPTITLPVLKEYLIQHLYPTREERLEQDVQFLPHTAHGTKGEYYITQMGDAGHISKELRNAAAFPVNIKNEDIRQKFEDSFDKIKELLKKHPALQIATGGSESICLPAIKEVLMNVLYPQSDPDFPDYDYPEIKKPVHVERALYAKALF